MTRRVPVRLTDVDPRVLRRVARELAAQETSLDRALDIIAAAVQPSDEPYYVDEVALDDPAIVAKLRVVPRKRGLSQRERPKAPVLRDVA